MATTHIRITAKREGFRRAGMAHSTTPTTHKVKAFTAAQLEQMKAESMLVVEEVEAPGKAQNVESNEAGEAGDDKSDAKAKGAKK